MIAVCVGTGVGFNAVLARKLGEQKLDEAASVACHGYFLFFCSWIIFLLFGLFGVRFFFQASIDDPVVVEDGVRYLSICCCFSIGMAMQFVSERVLQCSGKAHGILDRTGLGRADQQVLDPVLIFLF